MPNCPKCGGYVKAEETECPHCGHRDDFAELARIEKAHREENFGPNSEMQALEREAAKREAEANDKHQRELRAVHLSTLPYVPGHEIVESVGLVSAEIAIGQGVFSQISSEITNILGMRGSAFESKWREIREAAKSTLREHALELGCNAVIGVDSEVVALSGATVFHHSLMIVMNGTAVKIAGTKAGTHVHAAGL